MRHLRWLAVVVATLALLGSACGNSGDDDDTASDTTTTAAPEEGDDTGADDTDTGDDTSADDTGSDDETAADRDTFVAVEGVPGVSDDEISVTAIGTKANNPLGTCILDCYVSGIEAYFDYQNSLGGVFGRDLVVGEVLDDELTLNLDKAQQVIADDDALATFNAALAAAGWGALDDAGIPNFTWSIHAAEAAGRETQFGYVGVICTDCTGRYVPYLAQQAGATKVAALGYGISENSKICAQGLERSFELYGEDIGGVEFVYLNDEMEFGLPNGVGPQVTEMIDLGVDFVGSCMDLNGMRVLAEEFERQNYRDQVTLQHPNTYDADFVAATGDLFDGDYVSPGFAAFEYEGVPELDTYKEWIASTGGEQSELTMIGWINAATFVEGLIANGPEISREGIVESLNDGRLVDVNGLIVPIDWSIQHEPVTDADRSGGSPIECSSIVQMQGGAFEVVSEPDKPFLCWPSDDRSWSEPTPTNFAE